MYMTSISKYSCTHLKRVKNKLTRKQQKSLAYPSYAQSWYVPVSRGAISKKLSRYTRKLSILRISDTLKIQFIPDKAHMHTNPIPHIKRFLVRWSNPSTIQLLRFYRMQQSTGNKCFILSHRKENMHTQDFNQ